MSWNALRSRNCDVLIPLTARTGLPVAFAVAMPVIELVCPGEPVTSDTPGVRVILPQPSAM